MSQEAQIVCKLYLCGGLGNQLFQYAFARSLTLRSHAKLAIDTQTLFRRDFTYQRKCDLELFKLDEEVSLIKDAQAFPRIRRKLMEWQSQEKLLEDRSIIIERAPFNYQSNYRDFILTRNVGLIGYWQSEKYFTEEAPRIRKELQFSSQVSSGVLEWYSRIVNELSVGVHVRRIQYESRMSESYYAKSMSYMRDRLKSPHFFVFSDDPNWCRQSGLFGADCTIVCVEGGSALNDFRLLSACHHFIIANSSFSWWAAWLSQCEDKIVISPEAKEWSNPDSVCENWNILE